MMQQTYQEKQHVVGEHVKLFKEVAGTILAVYVVVSAAILYLKYSFLVLMTTFTMGMAVL